MSTTLNTTNVALISLQNLCDNASVLSSNIHGFLSENGYNIVESLEDAGTIVINTCVFDDTKKHKDESFVDNIVSSYPAKKVVVVGCLPNTTKKFANMNNVIMVGTGEMDKLYRIFRNDVRFGSFVVKPDSSSLMGVIGMSGDYSPVQISTGCSNNCSYCAIKTAKGHVKSRSIDDIKKYIRLLLERGENRIFLISDDCGSYGMDIGTNISELVDVILSMNGGIKMKIYSMYPALFVKHYPSLRKHFANKRINHIGVPLQSGSSRILKLMNRSYDIDEIKSLVRDLKECNPEAKVISNIIYNFPTETMDDFKKSVKASMIFDYSLFFRYCETTGSKSSYIYPKCGDADSKKKSVILNKMIARGKVRGSIASHGIHN